MSNTIQIPVVNDEDDLNLTDISREVREGLIANRKSELSSLVVKLYHKADQLAKDKKRAEGEVKKLTEKLDKTIAKIDRLEKGDWSVLKELNKEESDGSK